MTRNFKREIKFPTQNKSLNSFNNKTEINRYTMPYSKYNNNTSNSNSQNQIYNISSRSSNKPLTSHHRTSNSNYQFRYNKNTDTINHDDQNNIPRNNNSILTNINNRYSQNKNNNITTNRFDNNNTLYKSNENKTTVNRRINHRVFDRVTANTNINKNINNNTKKYKL